MIDELLEAALSAYKVLNPRSRIDGQFRYRLNTSRRRQKECVLCGVGGPTWCAAWPKTVRAEAWEHAHVCVDPFAFAREEEP